jgi:hypothetical protein
MSQSLAFTPEVISLYLREDLAELENPMRRDHGVLLQDLRFLFRAYRYAVKPKEDWSPATPGRCAPADALNNYGGN